MTDTFSGFNRGALTFLRQLKKNNKREWFQANRETYDNEVLAPLKLLVEELDVRFGKFAPEFVGDPKRSIFRIYRDVRFSADKSPYKTHAASWFKHQNAGHGVGSETHGGGAGFYFHLEPGGSLVAGGIWMPPRPTLNQLRDSIAAKPAEFAKSMSATGFKRRFGKLSEEAMLTRRRADSCRVIPPSNGCVTSRSPCTLCWVTPRSSIADSRTVYRRTTRRCCRLSDGSTRR